MGWKRKFLFLGLSIVFILKTYLVFAEEVLVSDIGIKYHKETCQLEHGHDLKKVDKALALEEGYAPCRLCYQEDLPAKDQLRPTNQLIEVESVEKEQYVPKN